MLQKTQDRTETMNSFTEEWLQKHCTIEVTLTQLSYREGKWGSRQCRKKSSAARPWYPRKFLLASLCRMGPPEDVEILPNPKHDETYAVTRELVSKVLGHENRIFWRSSPIQLQNIQVTLVYNSYTALICSQSWKCQKFYMEGWNLSKIHSASALFL